jgi:large subunit ribosomal protein L25
MEKVLLLKAEVREHIGTKDAARIRKQGRIPAVVYGHKKVPVAVSLDAHNLVEGLHHGHRLADVQIGRKREKVIVKDLQYDHLGKNIIHVDLMRVDVKEMIKVTVPIELKGTAKGTHGGGIIQEHTDHLEIECKVTDIPESIVVSVAKSTEELEEEAPAAPEVITEAKAAEGEQSSETEGEKKKT